MKPKWTWQRKAAVTSVATAMVVTANIDQGDPAKELFEIPTLRAIGPGGPDADGDGLTDHFEELLGTSGLQSDSDGDSYWDAEELARQSNPLDGLSLPGSSPTSCGMGIYEKATTLRPVVAVYVFDGDIRTADLAMGARVGETLRNLPLSFFGKNSTIVKTPTLDPQAAVYVYDGTMNPQHVHRYGDLSLYSTTVNEEGPVIAADAVNLVSIDGVVVEQFLTSINSAPPTIKPVYETGTNTAGVYKPLGGSSGPPPPATWTSGKICEQKMVVGAVNGPVVLQEVTSADCKDGWASFCGSDCTSSVGKTVQMLDPLALIGG
jgi:hypothetical protein